MEGAMPGHVIAKTWVHRDVDGSCSDMQIVSENFSDCQASQVHLCVNRRCHQLHV